MFLAAPAWMLYASQSASTEAFAGALRDFEKAVRQESDVRRLGTLGQLLPPDGTLALIVKKQSGALSLAEAGHLIDESRFEDAANLVRESLDYYESMEARSQIGESYIAAAQRLKLGKRARQAAEACAASLDFYDSPSHRAAIRDVCPAEAPSLLGCCASRLWSRAGCGPHFPNPVLIHRHLHPL